MALIFMDGFEEYSATTAFLTEIVSSYVNNGCGWVHFEYQNAGYLNSTTTTVRTNSSGNGKSLYNFSQSYLTMRVPSLTEAVVGFGVYTATAGSNSICYLSSALPPGYSSHITNGIRIVRNTDGTVSVVNNNTSAVLGTSASSVFPLSSWHYIEVRYKFNVAGDIQVRVDGTEVINLTGIDTRGAATDISYISLRGGNTSSGLFYFDDFYVCDTAGTTNNTFLGQIGVYTLAPTADASVQMTPSTGANYSCVDELPANSTDYVSATAASLMDLYAVQDLPAITPTAIAAVQVNARCMKPESNNAGLQLGVRSSGISSFGTTKIVPVSSWVTNFSIFETQPGGGAWDKTAIDNMDVGILST